MIEPRFVVLAQSLVGETGLEPARLAPRDPKSRVSAISPLARPPAPTAEHFWRFLPLTDGLKGKRFLRMVPIPIVLPQPPHLNGGFRDLKIALARRPSLPNLPLQRIMPSVFIKTYGCQMNERDSEAVAAQLVAKGYSLAPNELVADVVLLNTCSVRDQAEQKALGKMGNLAGLARKQGRSPILGFLGCMAQSRGRELIDSLPEVDLVLGTQKFHRTADYLDELLAGRSRKIVDIEEEAGSQGTIREHLAAAEGRKAVSAFVSIMQGCNQHCTFCIVPDTRGPERSRSIPEIVAECEELVAQGVREITLLGQIVTSFGRREYPPLDGR